MELTLTLELWRSFGTPGAELGVDEGDRRCLVALLAEVYSVGIVARSRGGRWVGLARGVFLRGERGVFWYENCS